MSANISEVAEYSSLTSHIFGYLSLKELLNDAFESLSFPLGTSLPLVPIALYRLAFQIVDYSQH